MSKRLIDEATVKLVLEALENHEGNYKLGDAGCDRQEKAITALKALAEQPAQQEPVAIALNTGTKQGVKWLRNVEHGKNLYTTPQPAQRKPLTDDELADLWYKQSLDWMEFARAIEAAHNIKENT